MDDMHGSNYSYRYWGEKPLMIKKNKITYVTYEFSISIVKDSHLIHYIAFCERNNIFILWLLWQFYSLIFGLSGFMGFDHLTNPYLYPVKHRNVIPYFFHIVNRSLDDICSFLMNISGCVFALAFCIPSWHRRNYVT